MFRAVEAIFRFPFSISCQDVLFLNDDRRPERVYPVNVTLEGTNGLSGTVTLETDGAGSKLSFDPSMDAPTNRLEFAMGVEEGDWFTSGRTVYLSCGDIGEGRIDAAIAFTNGTTCTTSTTFRVIEPLRKLVTSDMDKGRVVNPSRLVWGTNAVLKVDMRGELDRTNVVWRVVEGPGRVFNDNGFTTEIEATASSGRVVVEARFNQDETQPHFELPIVKPRIVPLRIGIVSPPAKESRAAWTIEDIRKSIDDINDVFSQIGVTFLVAGLTNITDRTQAWNLVKYQTEGVPGTEDSWEDETEDYSFLQSVNTERDTIRKGGNAIEIFFVGTIRDSADVSEDVQFAFELNGQVYIPKGMPGIVLAHEIGHVLGLKDIYVDNRYDERGLKRQWIELPQKADPVYRGFFTEGSHDWGREQGRGFYERTDSQGLIIREFLMYGYQESERKACFDIPDDAVRGVPASATRLEQIRHIPIGAKTVEKTIKERQR